MLRALAPVTPRPAVLKLPPVAPRAHSNSSFSRVVAEGLLRLLCTEVAELCAQADDDPKPWCSVLKLSEDGVTREYFRVLRDFDMARVKSHVKDKLEQLA